MIIRDISYPYKSRIHSFLMRMCPMHFYNPYSVSTLVF